MNEAWEPAETNTHQDHVIAHVVGSTVLGYLVVADAIHLLLDIGFIWKIYTDAEMGLLPHPVAVAELEVMDAERQQIAADIDLRLRIADDPAAFKRLRVFSSECLIEQVELFAKKEMKKLILLGEGANLELEMSALEESISITETPK
jgi:hypothetical protein